MNIKISQVVNAGIIIESSNTKILIDGIHNDKSTEYDTIGNELMDEIIYGNGKYQNINYLLYSHQHIDHFNKEKNLEYIKNNKVEKLLISDFNDRELINNEILTELKTDYFEVSSMNFNQTGIRYFKTRHLEENKYGTSHYSFIISIKNKNILYVGDADYSKDELKEPLKGYKIDIVISPFLIATAASGRILLKNISPDLLILNHLPNKDNDIFSYRNITEKAIKRYLTKIPKVCIFQELNDNVIVNDSGDGL